MKQDRRSPEHVLENTSTYCYPLIEKRHKRFEAVEVPELPCKIMGVNIPTQVNLIMFLKYSS